MGRADKAVLRLTAGLGLSVLIAYGLGIGVPFLACVMAVLMLSKPGPPIPFIKGAVLSVIVAVLLAAGVLLVPLLENYAFTGVAVAGALLYGVFRAGARANPVMVTILAIAISVIPVAGVAEQALALMVSGAFAVGLATGIAMASLSHALFPDSPELTHEAAPCAAPNGETVGWRAFRATLVVMPVFVLALTNPALYLAAVVKAVALAQQASLTDARSAGRELMGSTIVGAAMAAAVWLGLSMWPSLWMLVLWMSAAALWAGVRLFQVKASSFPPSFWSNALVTMVILLGPAIEDSASGKDVYRASAVRVSLFVVVALYTWATVWALERWQASRLR